MVWSRQQAAEILLGVWFIKAKFSKELDEQLGLVNELVSKQMAQLTVKCTCCGKTIVYRGVVIPKCTNCSGKVPSKNHQDPAEAQTQAQTQTEKKKKSAKKTGKDDSDSSATSEKQCSENKLWRSDLYYHAVVEKPKILEVVHAKSTGRRAIIYPQCIPQSKG